MTQNMLDKIMREKEVTSGDLAAMTGISQRTIEGYRGGRRSEPSFTNGLRIAKALEVKPEELLRPNILETKTLVNSFDDELQYTDLSEAKSHFTPLDEVDFGTYLKEWEEYKNGIKSAGTLEELADVLNQYTDLFDNGSTYEVKVSQVTLGDDIW